MKLNKYDIVHAHSSKAGLICRLAAKAAGVKKIVYTPHGHVFYGYFGKLLTRIIIFAEAMAARITDRIVGLTQAECDEWLKFGIGKPSQYVVIPSGLDLSLKEKGAHEGRDFKQEINIVSDKVLVGSVGRFVEIKGYRYLIEAAGELAKERDDIYFLLAGDGPLRGEYKSMIGAYGLEGRFRVVGWQENIHDIINSMDIFVLPSLNEGMGRVLVEAMLLEVPVVATRVGGVPSVVEEGEGVLVEPASAKAIAEAVRGILKDPVKTEMMVMKAKQKAIRGYSSATMVEKLDSMYRELLEIDKG